MRIGRSRTLIPSAYADLDRWPLIDANALPAEAAHQFLLRKQAVELYATGVPYREILEKTGRCDEEVRRLVKRCVTADGRGGIRGFTALVPGSRLVQYTREKEISPISKFGGYAGALQKLFRRYPEIEESIIEAVLKLPSKRLVHEVRAEYTSIHIAFLKELRELQVPENEWPFCTANKGYNAIRDYCISLRDENLARYVHARSGEDAARKENIGRGLRSILPIVRPYTFVQLDYHKIDAAAIVVIKTPTGTLIEVPVARWHIGILVEEMYKAVLGVCVTLELNPSSESALQTVENALRPEIFLEDDPKCAFATDGKIVINQFIPELSHQTFCVLKIDNAWSNTCTDVVNNVIDVVGCAVNFGPVYRWWMRWLVEKIIGELTKRGAQRLPSSYGSGPKDTRVSDPAGNAIKFKILLTELISVIYGCVRQYNTRRNEGLHYASPLEALQAALNNPRSGLFPQPVPVAQKNDLRLLMHVAEATVNGSINKHIRPFFKVARCRYTNPVLSADYGFVGKKVVVYVDRRTCSVTAVVKDTGYELGLMVPEKRWSQPHTWQERLQILRAGVSLRLASDTDVVGDFLRQKHKKLASRQSREDTRQSKEALHLAKRKMNNKSTTNTQQAQSAKKSTTDKDQTVERIANPFGIFSPFKTSSKGVKK